MDRKARSERGVCSLKCIAKKKLIKTRKINCLMTLGTYLPNVYPLYCQSRGAYVAGVDFITAEEVSNRS